MNKQHLKAPTVFLFFILAASAMAQVKEITIQALDGKTGKPLANQRLLVFAGDTAAGCTFDYQDFVLTTGLEREPPLSRLRTRSGFKFGLNGLTLCQTKANSFSLNHQTIAHARIVRTENCSRLAQAPKSAVFIAVPDVSSVFRKDGEIALPVSLGSFTEHHRNEMELAHAPHRPKPAFSKTECSWP